MGVRAGVVVTGTEVLTGRVADRNGPWLAEELRRLGVDIAYTLVVGDRPDDVRASLEFLTDSGVDLVITSGGLGPTADDLTAAVVAEHQGRPLQFDDALHDRIADILARLSAGRGWRADPAATEAGTRKQAQVPAGASVLEPVGTAPGLVVPVADGRTGPPVVVLPGPPRELQSMWAAVLADPHVRSVLAHADELQQRTIRIWNTPESEIAATLRTHADIAAPLEITTCLRDGELEIVSRFGPDRSADYERLRQLIVDEYGDAVFSPDGASIDELVAGALLSRGLTIATAESCTAGLLAGRLADRPGSSAYLLGGVVSYSNEAKQDLLGVPADLIAGVGAVSAEVARAMADGARRALHADVGVGITGIAGPDGGTPEKPVGLVHLCASDGDRVVAREVRLPGGRDDVRRRAVVIALQMILGLVGG